MGKRNVVVANNALHTKSTLQAEPKFTVVTVSLNSENVIRKTISSVLNQTVPPYEYIVIDGKSADNTIEIAKSFCDDFEKKSIKYTIVSEKDTGAYNAMNKGIQLATGDFISFLNSGDWYELCAIEKIKAFYKEEPFDLTYGGIHYVTPDGNAMVKMSRLDHYLISTRNWNHPSMFLAREIYQKFGFDERYPIYADFDLYLKLRKDGTKIRIIDEVITNFVAGGVSSDIDFKRTIHRTAEKYRVYRTNGYNCLYWIECYGWALAKNAILWLHRGRKKPNEQK